LELKKGLEDVAIKETSITFIDGELGRLYYRGYSVYDLASFSNFEEVAYLIWYGKLPTRKELEDFRKLMAEERKVPDHILASSGRCLGTPIPRTCLEQRSA